MAQGANPPDDTTVSAHGVRNTLEHSADDLVDQGAHLSETGTFQASECTFVYSGFLTWLLSSMECRLFDWGFHTLDR